MCSTAVTNFFSSQVNKNEQASSIQLASTKEVCWSYVISNRFPSYLSSYSDLNPHEHRDY